MFKDIHPEWITIIQSDKIKGHFNAALRSMNKYLVDKGVTIHHLEKNGPNVYLRPGIGNVLAFLRYCRPSEVKAIIVAQDPYPRPDMACGLAFAHPVAESVQPSLANIFETLIHKKLVNRVGDGCDTTLTAWASQGILLMNRYLTRSPNIKCISGNVSQDTAAAIYIEGNGGKENIHLAWGKFTYALIQFVLDDVPREAAGLLPILLWGAEAHTLADELIPTNARILKWCHPSPIIPNNTKASDPRSFRNCDHFTILSVEHGINWDPNVVKKVKKMATATLAPVMADVVKTVSVNDDDIVQTTSTWLNTPIVVACDGSCSGNGRDDATGGYAAYWPAKFRDKDNLFTSRSVIGKVPEYILDTPWAEAAVEGGSMAVREMIDINLATGELTIGRDFTCTSKFVAVTNNRAELLGAIVAITHILHTLQDKLPPIVMIFDSTYTLLIITERIWKWYAQSSAFIGRANSDLLIILHGLLCEMADRYSPGCGQEMAQAILIDPARQHDGDKVIKLIATEYNWNWKSLLCVYQRAHQKDDNLVGIDKELHSANAIVDDLADRGAKVVTEKATFAPLFML
jgi:uracil DNA glycosylase/ribonuclease HI